MIKKKTNINSKSFTVAIVLVIALMFFLTRLVWGWTSPSANPPSGGGALYYYNNNVGISTTTPSYPLTVSTSTDSLFGLVRSGAAYPAIFKLGADSALVINAGASDVLTLKSGNVGIGTTTPTTGKLVVSGGKLDMSTNEIINVAGPTASSSVATKGYVDAAATGRGPVIAMSAESAATYTHANAAKYCYDLSAAAAVAMDGNTTTIYTDWRLPTVGEAAVFEGTITSTNYIWTATMYEATNNNWLKLRLSDGKWGYNAESSTVNHVRCVR